MSEIFSSIPLFEVVYSYHGSIIPVRQFNDELSAFHYAIFLSELNKRMYFVRQL